MPITIELSLVDDMQDPIISNLNHAGFTAGNTPLTWSIINAQVKCDLVTLDSGLNESYIKLLEEGKKLTLNYNTFISQYQTITNQTNFSINIKVFNTSEVSFRVAVDGLRSSKEYYSWH